jgi:hypothetical protein
MIMLNTDFSNEEKDILKKYAGKAYDILSSIEGKSYALNNIKGKYLYNDCFKLLRTFRETNLWKKKCLF